MPTILRQSDTKYIVCDTDYTARIADNPIKKYDYNNNKWIDQKSEKGFIHYTYEDLLNIKAGDDTKINKKTRYKY